jgi:hypothetical protein
VIARIVEALCARGFVVQGTGGGCEVLVLPLRDGTLVVHDGDAALPTDEGTAEILVYAGDAWTSGNSDEPEVGYAGPVATVQDMLVEWPPTECRAASGTTWWASPFSVDDVRDLLAATADLDLTFADGFDYRTLEAVS